MKIVILDGYSTNPGDLSWNGFNTLGDLKVYDRTTSDSIIERCFDAECILTNKVVIDSEIMDKLPNLIYIGVLATGYNVVDIEAAVKRGIVVTNIPAYSTDSVVQMTFAHIFNITNRVGEYSVDNRQGKWSANQDFCYWKYPMYELVGKKIGVIGLGKIGMKVAMLSMMFGMEVLAVTSKHSETLPPGIQKVTLDELMSNCDIITLHCPLSKTTHEIINSETLSKIKPGAILINTGRGALVNEYAVAESLRSGHLGAYGTDVMCQEPPAADNPLFALPNAFVTPHVAWATVESRERLMSIAEENLRAFMKGSPVNVVKQ